MNQCFNCQSTEVIKGGISESGATLTHRPFFKPDSLKPFSMTTKAGVPVAAYACRNCGLVWAAADPEALRTFMEKNCG